MVKTRLAPAESACALYAAFMQDTFATVDEALVLVPGDGFERVFSCAIDGEGSLLEAAKLPPAGWRTIVQRGRDLGDRIAHAREASGAEHAVILGSDAPTLPAVRVLEAFVALSPMMGDEAFCHPRAVIGPAMDGGYYLIGTSSSEVLEALLADIPWSTPRVLDATRRRARGAEIDLVELAIGYDVDRPKDLRRILEDVRESGGLARNTRRAIEKLGVAGP